jgi:hypothetical protein
VQVLVEVRSGRWQEQRLFELLECSPDTDIADLKQRAAAAAFAAEGAAGGTSPANASDAAEAAPGQQQQPQMRQQQQEQELRFLGQTCEDGKRLRDYGVCHDWVAQVAGFVLRPRPAPGQPW